MPTDGAILKAFMDQSRIRPVRVYSSMNISKQAFYKLYNSKEFEPDTIKKLEVAIGKKWEEIRLTKVDDNVSRETQEKPKEVDLNLQTLIGSNKLLAEANKKLSDAHYLLAEDQRELMRRVNQATTANAPEQNHADVKAMRSVVLELLFEIGSGKLRLKSVDEGRAIYRKRIAAALALDESKDTQKSSGKKGKETLRT